MSFEISQRRKQEPAEYERITQYPTAVGTIQPPIADHPAFICHRRKTISSLNLTMEEYEHRATGAIHYHLDSDNPENVFWSFPNRTDGLHRRCTYP